MKHRILVVDRDSSACMAMAEQLMHSGYGVQTANDGVEAFNKLKDNGFDLVMMDPDLPGMDGLSVLRKIRQSGKEPAVIFLPASGSVRGAVEAMKAGVADYIPKPFPPDEIESLVSGTLRRIAEHRELPPREGVRGEPVILTQSPAMERLIRLARSVAPSQASVLIQGESGTGKELFARLLHAAGDRFRGPFVAVNCAAIPENLLESELFGHEKGAFTGAISRRLGKFELAHQGTLLLDEISEMPMPLQAKLLRVLQEYEITRVGGRNAIRLDVRVVATTNRDLKKEVADGRFREDLFYRLNVIPLSIPPLRERKEDIPLLVDYFVKQACVRNARPVKELTKSAMDMLRAHDWKGNVREIENTIERAVLVSMEGPIEPEHLMLHEEGAKREVPQPEQTGESISFRAGHTMWEVEKGMILHTLGKVDGNRTHAAKMLGISIRTLRNKINEYKERGEITDI